MMIHKWWQYLLLAVVIAALSLMALVGIAVAVIYPSLPSLEALTNYHPKQPLRVYSADGYLISEFGQERRAYVKIENVPQDMKNALIAIEDRRFYKHNGIDLKGIARAAISNLKGGSKEGASTITMQVARNFFLSSERNYKRKINEALLALKIEKSLSKDQILELYINQIYLGQRAYGFAAAAQVYYGKPLEKLNLAETALLAGLPKAPSSYNPYVNPKRASTRQKEVLMDMLRNQFISQAQYDQAYQMPLKYKASKQSRDLDAEYVAEIVRDSLYQKYQDDIYISGLKVYTTILKTNQEAANNAVREGILEYDLRHAYRGTEKTIKLNGLSEEAAIIAIDEAFEELQAFNGMHPAIVTVINSKYIQAMTKLGETIRISGRGLTLVANAMQKPDVSSRPIKIGSVIRVLKNSALKADENWQIVQLPQVESAFIGLDSDTGAVRALVGGFDFNRNKFNHVTQAWRQPGSSFKPFIYSAALEKGLTPASMFEDAPLTFSAGEVGPKAWTPNNYDGTFDGPMSMRQALIKSKNMVSIRILQAIDAYYAQDYIARFGFDAKRHPPYLTMALGAGSVTPWQMAGAYAVFANGGYRVKPNLISKIVDANDKVIFEAKFDRASVNAPRVIDARNAFMMTSMLRDVVRRGTATKAMALGRYDLAGKTGTTNNSIDAWFAGYNGKQVGVAWIGFDKPRSLGARETGGGVALPIWIKYMATVLKGTPNTELFVPNGIDALMVDQSTGMLTDSEQNAIPEYFYAEYPPPEVIVPLPPLLNEENPIDQLIKLLSPAQNLSTKPTDNNGKVDTTPKKSAPNNVTDGRQSSGADSFVDQASQRGR